MGLRLFSSSSYDKDYDGRSTNNPNPTHYRIDKHVQIGKYLVLLAIYPDCKNYEGKKVMVYKDLNIRQVENFKSLDPHFSDNKNCTSPIARFEPTTEGWEDALAYCRWKAF